MTILTGQGQGPLEVISGLLAAGQAEVGDAEADQRVDFGVPVPGFAAQGDGPPAVALNENPEIGGIVI